MNIYNHQLEELNAQLLPWEKLSNRTILISGATGMIGKCLIDTLMLRNVLKNSNIHIVAISRDEKKAKERLEAYWEKDLFNYISCNINEKIPECGSVDYVVHAASNTHPLQYAEDPIGTITSNVIGTKNLLDYAVTHKAKHFCFVSSVEIYGENRGDTEKFEESYLGYLDCNTMRAGYPESKRLGETLCNAYYKTYGLEFSIVRLSRVYGPTMLKSDTKAISQFIKNAASGENIVLKSEGNQKYSYTFVTDAVGGILYTMLLGQSGEAYNVADEESDITLKKLAEMLAGITNTKVIFELPEEGERQGYSTATKAMQDPGKLKRLGWKPFIHMAEGLRCTVEELRAKAD